MSEPHIQRAPKPVSDTPPDYTAMNGAEFQRAVGTDPEKWAEAYMQCADPALSRPHAVAALTHWFADAMTAAVKAKPPPIIEET